MFNKKLYADYNYFFLEYNQIIKKYNNYKDYKLLFFNDITLDEATENYYDYGVEYEKVQEPPKKSNEDEVKIVDHTKNTEHNNREKNKIPPVKSSINLLSTLKKSMGDEETGNNTKEETNKKDLELTDDLFNLIDSMYDEGKD